MQNFIVLSQKLWPVVEHKKQLQKEKHIEGCLMSHSNFWSAQLSQSIVQIHLLLYL
jgi:hypothetical protein